MSNALTFKDEVGSNRFGDSIIGTLEGPCADLLEGTRNGRLYTKALWENVFRSEKFNEYIENGGVIGELDHPETRVETLLKEAAIKMSEKPYMRNNQLMAKFDILNTPNGQIAKTLAQAGISLGISSRGNGETYIKEGKELVDEESYDFEAFDLVYLPAVKNARMTLIKESKNNPSLLTSLKRLVESANAGDKKILIGTLNRMDIQLEEDVKKEKNKTKKINLDTIDKAINESIINNATNEVNTAGESDTAMLKDLQESIQLNIKLEDQNVALLERVSAGNARETKYREEIVKLKAIERELTEKLNKSNARGQLVEKLDGERKKLNEVHQKTLKHDKILIESLKQDFAEKETAYKSQITKLQKEKIMVESSKDYYKETLNESLKSKDSQIQQLENEKKSLKENYNNFKTKLTEQYDKAVKINETLKKDSIIKIDNLSKKLEESYSKSKVLNERLQDIADNYIETICRTRGLNVNTFKASLPPFYTSKDVKQITENLKSYKVRVGTLPFETGSVNIQGVNNDEPLLQVNRVVNPDADISDSLLDSVFKKN